jgi:hypothetical protein
MQTRIWFSLARHDRERSRRSFRNCIYPDGVTDDTQFSEDGARRMAEPVLEGVEALDLGLAGHVVWDGRRHLRPGSDSVASLASASIGRGHVAGASDDSGSNDDIEDPEGRHEADQHHPDQESSRHAAEDVLIGRDLGEEHAQLPVVLADGDAR